jgi:6-pyruvoyltetrahydropterin/6-carboxytetrahydropterin synthase
VYAIKVQSDFSAAHNLRGYRGKCERLHGHNWKVEAEIISSRLNNLTMVCDFKEVKKNLKKVLEKLDHTYLNRLPYFKKNNPTSEKLAEFIYYSLKRLIKDKNIILKRVCVWETETQQASFSEEVF